LMRTNPRRPEDNPKSPEDWLRELDYLARLPEQAAFTSAHSRWSRLMRALGVQLGEFNRCVGKGYAGNSTSLAQARFGFGWLDVIAVVRRREWKEEKFLSRPGAFEKFRSNPLAFIKKRAQSLHMHGDCGKRRGIVTGTGAHKGGFRNPYAEDEDLVLWGAEVNKEAARLACEVRVENAHPDPRPSQTFRDRYVPKDRLAEMEPWLPREDSPAPDIERVAREAGFDEFETLALMYQIRDVSRRDACKAEREKHGDMTATALETAYRRLGRTNGMARLKQAIRDRNLAKRPRKASEFQRNGKNGLLDLGQVARHFGVKPPEVENLVHEGALVPVNGKIPLYFHPNECDRYLRKQPRQDDPGCGIPGCCPPLPLEEWPDWAHNSVKICVGGAVKQAKNVPRNAIFKASI
jgi:hypothetical protein